MAAETTALESAFPAIEELHVDAFRNQDWCKNIAYGRGAFSNNLESSTCNLFDEHPMPFDVEAQADFDQLATALSATGVAVIWVDVYAAEPASEATMSFEVVPRAIGAQHWTYVYEPMYVLPADMEGEAEYTAIDANWYFAWGDWM